MKTHRRIRGWKVVLKVIFLVCFTGVIGIFVAAVAIGSIKPERTVSFCEAFDECTEEKMPEEIVVVEPKTEPRGTIYLTFDDGPGDYTNALLDILKKYGVKATFFVTGRGDDETILREYEEGHAIGLHTLSHNYSYIYANADNFFDDLYAVQERVKAITGKTTMLMRFPGGSSNTVSRRYDHRTRIMSYLTGAVERLGFTYFDWNIVSGDAGETTDTNEVIENVTSRLEEPGDYIVLQHDIKDFSVAAVESIVVYGFENGYNFKKLSSSSPTFHHGVNN